jgi:hypothetical protein
MPTSRITAAVVARMTSGDTTWDSEVSGFGIPRKRDRLYLVKTRIHGKQRALTMDAMDAAHGDQRRPDTDRRGGLFVCCRRPGFDGDRLGQADKSSLLLAPWRRYSTVRPRRTGAEPVARYAYYDDREQVDRRTKCQKTRACWKMSSLISWPCKVPDRRWPTLRRGLAGGEARGGGEIKLSDAIVTVGRPVVVGVNQAVLSQPISE